MSTLSLLWYEMSKNRLTASKFGEISKRCKSTPCSRIMKDILYPKPFSNDAINWGNEHEKTAIEEYCKTTGNTVLSAGLFICQAHGYLGASPD